MGFGHLYILYFFFFNDTATTEIYTLSLHDALPICDRRVGGEAPARPARLVARAARPRAAAAARLRARAVHQHRDVAGDRKSTRLNSSHANISYAVFCLKKKKKTKAITRDYITDDSK